ncbi:MarR family transcriptional regulator [Lichenibacterium minor]|uniref:MarR family transcriptional regulator n=1 Tax=Lichenibacterium minor TaxID=2316528 RepID=A0A4Q2TZW2_9HYPH|nr:MarR family transcriptional regulator [Lichenibacterium minor]RYC29693.1 MarR family transcriptional regulator [Lichenibacterium minor]
MKENEIDSLADDLRRSVGDFVRAIRQGSGTTRSAQSETLDVLDRLGAMNVATLAEMRAVTHQTMRLVVAQLESSGFVTQEADPSDRRSRRVSLSAAGRDALARERTGRTSRIADEIRSKLSPTECDLLHNATMIIARLAAPKP